MTNRGLPRLADKLTLCGPVTDTIAATRARDTLAKAAEEHGWLPLLDPVWQALVPVFAASPYLFSLARRRPSSLRAILENDPLAHLDEILVAARIAGGQAQEAGRKTLRDLKADLHLLTALCDLGGVWDLNAVTAALTHFADVALEVALGLAARAEQERGTLNPPPSGAQGPVPGLFCFAMGKQGAFELNYSSDIDICIFYEPAAMLLTEGAEGAVVAVRLAKAIVQTLQDRTEAGYVFRTDLRLRPDPGSMPLAVSVDSAMDYYESVGQNWERAAFIKARAVGGDIPRAQAFLKAMQAFIWRRNLDFGAISDIHSIKRQIHAHKTDERLEAKGHDLKLGRGGIREIEFFVQTQQLILGGRQLNLRSPRTLDALEALTTAGHVEPDAAAELSAAYHDLRALEHRVQMLADEQTHRLPERDADRTRVAALWGRSSLPAFDREVGAMLRRVNSRYGKLFAGEEALSSRFGSLVFTGVDDDPETLATLKRMGFSDPARVSQDIRGWHFGRVNATRTARSRELFTRLAPRLLEACHATGNADDAFRRFGDFFASLSSSVGVQSLFLAQPRLLELVVRVMAYAPKLATTLAKRPGALDALLDPSFFGTVEISPNETAAWSDLAFEDAMDMARRFHREQSFLIGVQVMGGATTAAQAGAAFADLADAVMAGLAPTALAEAVRIGGAFPGETAVVALGKYGSREMSAGSDLDLMTVYRAALPDATSALKGWAAETFYGRFTQRLVAALSIPTAEGELYAVDLQLRPSGTKGPVAVSFQALQDYYAGEAETWELLALTRARVAWSSSAAFGAQVESAITTALRRPRLVAQTAKDVREMRALMERERPPFGFWDMKLGEGGLVDIEFTAQFLQIVHAGQGGPLAQNTAIALEAFQSAGLADPSTIANLLGAWRLQQNLTELLQLALDDRTDPEFEPTAFHALLARAGNAKDFKALKTILTAARTAARAAYDATVRP
jgi:[glutamine synthetase] adenylyltransferase / [glutamine synthetase]-adenylyl-L-tyrosine phosphorylase